MKKIIPFLWKYLMQQKWWFLLSLVSILLAYVTPLLIPIVYKELINIASLGVSQSSIQLIYHQAWLFVLLVLITQIGWKTLEIWIIPLETRICRQIYIDGFTRIMAQSQQFFTENFSGSIVKQISRLQEKTENMIDIFIFNISGLAISVVTMTVVLALEDMLLGVLIFVWMLAVIVAKKYLWGWKLKFNEKVAKEDSKVSARLSDSFTNALTVITSGMQMKEIKCFTSTVDSWYKVWTKAWWIDNGIFFVSTVFIVILQIGTIYGTIHLWSLGKIQVGTFVLLISYLTIFIDQVVKVNFMYRDLFRTAGDMIEAIDMMNTPLTLVDRDDAKVMKISEGSISFEHVNFSYNDGVTEVLKDFCLDIYAGEKVALVGLSGSGKSTVLKLLFRLYDTSSGVIQIDGQNIVEVTQESLRQSMSMVPQDPVLFHRTIAENITYSMDSEISDHPEKAARLAHAHEFISQLPEKYNTIVGERGVKLSGGERQRVAIARSIYANKSVLVMDEATSSLDSESEKMIQESLHEVMKGKTTIVIAHRLSTIMQMDRIIVMNQGMIVEEGSHETLLNMENGHYRRLWEIQTGEFIDDLAV